MTTYIFSALLLFSSVGFAQALQPGLWRASTSLDLNGIPLPPSEDEECITGSETKDVKNTIAKELKKKGCSLTKWSVKDKKLEASLKCSNEDFEAQGSLKGTVTPKSYDLTGEADGTFKMIPSSASLKLTGKWIKACNAK